jgi:hypothetical protein
VYSLYGSPGAMTDEMVQFAQLGVEDLVVVFDASDPAGLVSQMTRFDDEVVQPFRGRAAAEVGAGP